MSIQDVVHKWRRWRERERDGFAQIRYSGFFDAPLAFIVGHQGQLFFFWREFDESMDEYADSYEVYLLPGDVRVEEVRTAEQWRALRTTCLARLGPVPVSSVEFDRSRRKAIRTSLLDRLVV